MQRFLKYACSLSASPFFGISEAINQEPLSVCRQWSYGEAARVALPESEMLGMTVCRSGGMADTHV